MKLTTAIELGLEVFRALGNDPNPAFIDKDGMINFAREVPAEVSQVINKNENEGGVEQGFNNEQIRKRLYDLSSNEKYSKRYVPLIKRYEVSKKFGEKTQFGTRVFFCG